MNSSVTYYRVNANNQSIASSYDGLGQTSPTEEITAPVLGGTYASGGGTTTIVGQTPGSTFDTSFAVGQYLYYINNAGNYVLIGQIQAIGDDHTLTLTSVITYTNPTAGDSLVASYYLITISEEIYVRVATDLNSVPSSVIVPNFAYWRNGNDPLISPNNPAIIAIDRISNVGTPLSTASAQNIPFTFQTQNVFTSGTGTQSNTVWPTENDFPTYIWLKLQFPAGQGLSPKTLYRFTTQETFVDYTATTGTSKTILASLGYSNV